MDVIAVSDISAFWGKDKQPRHHKVQGGSTKEDPRLLLEGVYYNEEAVWQSVFKLSRTVGRAQNDCPTCGCVFLLVLGAACLDDIGTNGAISRN